MSKLKKTLSLETITEKIIKAIAKEDKRTESAVVDLAIQEYAAKRQAASN